MWHYQPKWLNIPRPDIQKRALICALLTYVLLLLFVISAFRPSKKTVTLAFYGNVKPAMVKWSTSGKVGHGSRRKGRIGRGKRHGTSTQAKAPQIAPSSKIHKPLPEKIVSEKGSSKGKNKLKQKPLCAEKMAEKKDAKAPIVTEKKLKKPSKKEQKAAQELAKAEIKKIEKEIPVEQKQEAQKEPEILVKQPTSDAEVAQDDEILEIGITGSEEDVEEGEETISRDEYALMCAINRSWKLPRGISSRARAQLLVSISSQGKIEQVEIVKGSAVRAFDMAARAALYRASYPQVYWGKNIAVWFGQPEEG